MEYTPWLEKQIIGRMKVENPWWTEGQLANDYSAMSPRQYLNIFYPLVTSRDPRRAGTKFYSQSAYLCEFIGSFTAYSC